MADVRGENYIHRGVEWERSTRYTKKMVDGKKIQGDKHFQSLTGKTRLMIEMNEGRWYLQQ